MAFQSVSEITPDDLAKINRYLDDAEQSLVQHHSESETQEIILILREQIFQQIELQATVQEPFDIDEIISKNRRDNQALITGNDRNQVLFTIKKPSLSLKRGKVDEKQKPENDGSPTHRDISNQQIVEDNFNASIFLLPIAVLYLIFSFIPVDIVQVLGLLVLIPFLFISHKVIRTPSSRWILSHLIIALGAIISVFMLENTVYIYNDDIWIVGYFFLFLPAFSLISTSKFLDYDLIILNYNEKSGQYRTGVTLFFSAIVGLILYTLMFVFAITFGNDFLEPTGFIFFILVITVISYYYLSQTEIMNWDSILKDKIAENFDQEVSDGMIDNETEKPISSLAVYRKRIEDINSSWATRIAFFTGVMYFLLAALPDPIFQSFAFIILIPLIFLSIFVIKYPTSHWVVIQFVSFVGLLLSINNTLEYGAFDLYLIILVIVAPVFSVLIAYKVLSNNMIYSDYTNNSFWKQVGILLLATMILSGLHFFVALYILYELISYTDEWVLTGLIILTSTIIVSALFLRNYGDTWETNLAEQLAKREKGPVFPAEEVVGLRSDKTPAKDVSTEVESSGLRESSSADQQTSVVTDQSSSHVNLEGLIGDGSPTSRVELQVDMDLANKKIRFRYFTLSRSLLILVTMGVLAVSLFFSKLDYRYALLYYIELLGLENTYYGEDPWAFQRDVTYGLIYIGGGIIAFVFLLYLLEIFSYLQKSKMRTVIKHLVLRQGVITINSLSKIPPGMEAIEYYNHLGSLVMQGVISIRHMEVRQ